MSTFTFFRVKRFKFFISLKNNTLILCLPLFNTIIMIIIHPCAHTLLHGLAVIHDYQSLKDQLAKKIRSLGRGGDRILSGVER